MTFIAHEFESTWPSAICGRCGLTRRAWQAYAGPLGCEMVEVPAGECPHCGAFIGLAVATHARYCELRPQAKQAAVALHDPEKAEKGQCNCPVCATERALAG